MTETLEAPAVAESNGLIGVPDLQTMIEPPSFRENLHKAEETLRNVIDCFRYQVLSNIDEIAASLHKEFGPSVDREKIQRIKVLLDHMLKSPMQRQLNRIKSVADAITEFLPKPRS